MLETRVLLLCPPAADGSRVLADAATGAAVGCAEWHPATEYGWLHSLLGPVLHVSEAEEKPLVFTVHRSLLWWTQREVWDAEGDRVGYVTGSTVRDRRHRVWAWAHPSGEGIVYMGASGEDFASIRHTSQGIELAFTKYVERDPFAKMLLLTAALLRD